MLNLILLTIAIIIYGPLILSFASIIVNVISIVKIIIHKKKGKIWWRILLIILSIVVIGLYTYLELHMPPFDM